MYTDKLVFAQLIQWVPHYRFQRLVKRYKGDYKVSRFTYWDQFLCLFFAQLTYRESLRDIEACLHSRANLLYHLGIRGHVARSTLAEANEQRDWRIYAGLAQWLIARARKLYAQEAMGVDLDATLYAGRRDHQCDPGGPNHRHRRHALRLPHQFFESHARTGDRHYLLWA